MMSVQQLSGVKSYVQLHMVHVIFKLNGAVLETIMSDWTHNMIQFCEFSWYDSLGFALLLSPSQKTC